jgi:anaerobic selenocysteine-containing dehydrogenase
VLYRGGQFKTTDGKGHFSALLPPELTLPAGAFALSTRRGKQFNSMIYKAKDPNTGAGRDALFVNRADAEALGLREGDRVTVTSDNGQTMACRLHFAQIKPRNVQAYWPECNVLIRRRVCDVQAGVPDYNAIVEIVAAARATEPAAVGAAGVSGDAGHL